MTNLTAFMFLFVVTTFSVTANDATAQFIEQPAIKFRRLKVPTINKGIAALGYKPKDITVTLENFDLGDSGRIAGYYYPYAYLTIPYKSSGLPQSSISKNSGSGKLVRLLPTYTRSWNTVIVSSDATALSMGETVESEGVEQISAEGTEMYICVYYQPGFKSNKVRCVQSNVDTFAGLSKGELRSARTRIDANDGASFDLVLSSK